MTLHASFVEYVQGLLGLGLKMLLILIAVFIALEIVKRLRLLEKSLKGLNRVTRFMGFNEQAGLPLLAGVVFGIIFGAGVITSSIAEQKLDKKQVFLVSIFLAMCHGMIEDTGLLIVMGANVLWITIPRLILGVAVTWLVNRLYQPKSVGQGA